MSLLTTKRVVGAKLEASPGTGETLAAADFAHLMFSPSLNPDFESEERAPAGICSGQMVNSIGRRMARLRYECELRGSGTVDVLPKYAETFLQCSSLSSTITASTDIDFAPVTSFASQKTCTVWDNRDGRVTRAIGCMFNCSIRGEPGRKVMLTFDGVGVWDGVADVAIPAYGDIGHETTRPLRFAGVPLTLGGVDYSKVGSFEFDFGNSIQLRPDGLSTKGVGRAYMASRDPRLRLDPDARLVATEDLYGDTEAASTKALVLGPFGTTAGNRWTITAPAFQPLEPQEADRDGLAVDAINGRLVTLTGADDHFLMKHH